ncbi:leucine-rich repeat domain-containing protein [bacterium]|nr:leucine-rich repeat domain-containing protein [bacterium]
MFMEQMATDDGVLTPVPDYVWDDITKTLTINANTKTTFKERTDIKRVDIKEGVTTIEYGAFKGCSSLASVTFPETLTSIDNYAFFWCKSLASVTFGDALHTIGYRAFFWCSSLASVAFGDGLQTIGEQAFCGLGSSLASVVFPDGLQTIGNSAFSGCTSLIIFCRPGLTIPDFPQELVVNRTVHAALTAFLDAALSARRPEGLMRYAMRNRLGGRMSLLVARASIDTNRPTLADLRQAIADIEHEATRHKIKDWALGQLRDVDVHEYGGL